MEKYGCAFNPRPAPGRCIKDPSYNKVDSQCEAVNGTCKLVTSAAPSILPGTSFVLPIPPSALSPKSPQVSENVKSQRISGPVSSYITEINGKKYEFFGDIHQSISGGCSKPCQDINEMIKGVDLSDPKGCWDISVFLSGIFTEAAKQGKWIDFYLEIPYFKKENVPPREMVKERSLRAGHLYRLFTVFYTCFTKTKCDYSTTRFHYVDVRQEYTLDLQELVKTLQNMMEDEEKIDMGIRSYEMYLTMNKIEKAVDNLAQMFIYEDRTKNREIDETAALMRDYYFSGGQTMKGFIRPKNERLFALYLTSDNIYEDVKNLMEPSLKSVKNPLKLMESLLPSNLIVNRNGKNMHRIRAQLEALEKEGKGDIAQKIVQYLTEEFRNKADTNKVIDIWKAVETLYEGYINGRMRDMSGGKEMILKVKNEVSNLLKLSKYSVTTASLLMDGYLLARMFRTFPGKKHVDSYKSIVYAGEAHINTYVNFFEKYLGASFLKNTPNEAIYKKFENGTVTKKDLESVSRCLAVSTKDF